MKTQNEKAQFFRSLHHGPEILVLPNAWDCASARVLEQTGFPAIATTSAGVAFSLGYSDGERIPQDQMLAAVRRISGCVDIPVTADLESGYGDVAKTTAGLIAAGAVGLNLEDMQHESCTLGADSRAAGKNYHGAPHRRRTGRERGDQRAHRCVSRANRRCRVSFRTRLRTAAGLCGAGADCVFLPGVADEDIIRRAVETLKFPLNILAGANSPAIPRLRQLGVARVSVGSGIMRATLGLTRRIAQELKQSGTYSALVDGAMPFAEANALFDK